MRPHDWQAARSGVGSVLPMGKLSDTSAMQHRQRVRADRQAYPRYVRRANGHDFGADVRALRGIRFGCPRTKVRTQPLTPPLSGGWAILYATSVCRRRKTTSRTNRSAIVHSVDGRVHSLERIAGFAHHGHSMSRMGPCCPISGSARRGSGIRRPEGIASVLKAP